MNKRSTLYQEHVQMPNQSIGVNCFFYDCASAPYSSLFPLHWHEHFEMISIHEGELEIDIENEKYIYREGEIAVINPNYLHDGVRFTKGTKLYCLMVDMNLFRSRFSEMAEESFITPLINGKISFQPKISGDEALNDLMKKCYRIFTGEEYAFQLLLKSLMFELFYRLFRSYVQENNVDQSRPAVSVGRERVNAILEYINEHYAEKIMLDDLVSVVHINKFYICKIFQQCTGKTVLNYINVVRVQKAVERLISTNESVTNIAFAVGFQDLNYFSRIFKSVMGVSPTDIRRKYRDESSGERGRAPRKEQ